MATLQDFIAGMSKGAVAGGMGAPVDLTTLALNSLIAGGGYAGHKMGLLQTPSELIQNPTGGSEWIAEKMRSAGLLQDNPGSAGDNWGQAAGSLLGPLAAAKAPHIARGLLQAGENIAVPQTLSKQAGMVKMPFGQIPENADDLAALAGKKWFEPVDGMTKRLMSDAKAEKMTLEKLNNQAKWTFGRQNPSITYETATPKQRAVIDSMNLAVKPLKEITPEMQQAQYLKKLNEILGGQLGQVHKNVDLSFQSMPISAFDDGALIYKSPNYNGRQSSEYRTVMVDGVPAYARKSDHFGDFFTNIKEGSPEAIERGLVNGADGFFDPFGRVGFKAHNWKLLGDETKTKSKAGYIPLADILRF